MQPEIPQTAAPAENEAALQTLPDVTQTESAPAPVAPLEATEASHTERRGQRVLRTSPAVLISCGILFVSLIFLLNLMTQTGTTGAPEEVARTNAPSPEPSVQAAPAVEVASVVPQETEKKAPQPAPTATPVVKETQAPAKPQPDAAKPPSEDGFSLQIGSYNALAQARERVDELGAAGVSAYVAQVEIPKRGTWYRVQVGHFGSREEASRYGTQLRSKGAVADFIITPSKAS
jgi:cell division protein FtsN